MSLGTRHTVEGLLLRDARGDLMLRADRGGEWRLDADWRARRLVRLQVRFEGVRSGFDVLEAHKVAKARQT